MNERIIELAEQSGLEYNFDPMLWLKYEKFAELIVRECAKSAIDLESIPDWYQDSVSMIPHHCSKNILQHFGVEE